MRNRTGIVVEYEQSGIVVRRLARSMTRDAVEEPRSDDDRAADVEGPGDLEEPRLAEHPVRLVARLAQRIRVEEDQVAAPERHGELVVRRLVVEAEGEV